MKIHLRVSPIPAAEAAAASLQLQSVPETEADVIVVLGGDGFMLRTLHACQDFHKPYFGLNCGTVGFLMNKLSSNALLTRIQEALPTVLHPLRMEAKTLNGMTHIAHAINEVSLFRQTYQTTKIDVFVDHIRRVQDLISDGILVATPAGSTAYNSSLHGPIIPMGSPLLALTPISAFRPRRWRGALLPEHVHVTFKVQVPEQRRVSATADTEEVRDVTEVHVTQDKTRQVTLLFDPQHNLEERIISEQFIF